VLHEPADGAFDDPSAFDDGEAFDLGILGDDLDVDVDAEGGAVFDDGGLEAGVDLGLGRGGIGAGGPVEQVDADRVVAGGGGGDDHGEE
jgi:hypothetical protein